MKTKILLTILYLATLAAYVVAQTPGFNYQAVLRNPAGETMANEAVTLHFSLIDGPTETVIYKESQALNTDALGILICMIGAGTIESGTFSEITGKQDVTLKIEAELPGETGMTEVGNSKLGIIPYALYGKDEDADLHNEMQSLSIQEDSVKISGRGGVELNQLNYWQKSDSSYFLSLDQLGNINQRAFEDNGVVLELTPTVGSDDQILMTLATPKISKKISPQGEDINIQGVPLFKKRFFISELEIDEGDRNRLRIPSLTRGIYQRGPGYLEGRWASQDMTMAGSSCLFGDWRSNLSIGRDGSRLTSSYQDHDLVDFFVDLALGGVGTDLYKIGVDEFGYGFAVFCFDDDNTSQREQAATFGGTMSTANDNGLTTLVGAIPGIDPTNGYSIVFNGPNLGTLSSINSESAGSSSTYGANGQLNTTSGTFGGDNNGGAHITFAADGALGAYMWTKNDGSSQMGADQFIMTTAAPGRANESANYSAPVGGESATYDRGTARLVNGEATIICPESFRWIADEQSMTVTITPLSAESQGIAVIEKSTGGFKAKELHGGSGNYDFDYLVMCKRKGQEDFQVLQSKPALMIDHSREMQPKFPTGPLKSIRDLYRK
ncbi:MAG: hypothetical protein IPL46_09595 [Saprospiraceae bacterium]|nr:hypothetical protein [Saprospiraceae bacterium]